MTDELVAPTLPKGYRFAVKSLSSFAEVHLQQKSFFIFWDYVAGDMVENSPYHIHAAMLRLKDMHITNPNNVKYDGYYPPRKIIG